MYKKKDKKAGIGKHIVGDTIKVSLILVFVKCFGIIKQSVLAAYFGTGSDMDAYLVANDFISEIGVILFSSLSVSFLNFYLINRKKGKSEAEECTKSTLSIFIPIAAVITLVLILCAYPLSTILAPGFNQNQQLIVAQYIMVLAVTVISAALSNIFTAILEAEKDFIPSKLSGLIQSACIIIGCVFFSEIIGVNSLIFSFIVYYAIQNIFLFIRCRKYISIQLRRPKLKSEIKVILIQSIPLFVSNSAIQINSMVDKAVASSVASGIVSAISYSGVVFSSLGSIFIGSISSVIYSYFSSYAAENENDKMENLFKQGLYMFSMILIPIIIYTCYNSYGITKLLFMRGEFGHDETLLVSNIVIAYVIGLMFMAIRDISVYFFYANQNMTMPMLNTIIMVGVNIVSSIILSQKFGGFGIALGTSIGNFSGMLLMLLSVKNILSGKLKIMDCKMIFTLIISGGLSLIVMLGTNWIIDGLNFIIQLIINGVILFGVYFAILKILKCKYIKDILELIRNKNA